ncbi:MAG: tail fiber protein [Flavobacterium nitrogenifigens]|uniref:Microcystin-dependent protein n=1 Tax=Flavobacterium nitrogenifigens TaxID=1617283 RepID=A0A521FFM7_9FLAO|nr:tail fiber protein [Flavobacterium nitrogenifigens]KAF2339722.1 phage tail protein [Flavobacterium nitrogenifigens]MDQ8014739.1 tail fiber protein [Flavobacterium nitrogenifigens]SMO95008.1 Microcystin-dependent protein [Flavobacterium nitrogenifigens]
MATPYLGEIRIMSFNFAPKGWALCNGQFLPINQNQALFSLLGTMYGGNGQTTFALPNLRGKTPIHFGNGHTIGEQGGEEAHTLSVSELPQHTHVLQAKTDSVSTNIPSSSNLLANTAPNLVYSGQSQNFTSMNSGSLGSVGGSQPHLNMQPFLTLNFCIALVGIFPSQT